MSALLLAQDHGQEVLTPGTVGELMWLVPLLPFVAFFVILFFGKRLPGQGHVVGIAAIGIAWILSLVGFLELAAGRASIEQSWPWFSFGGGLELDCGMQYDLLTAVM